jgi:hypothetical protein
MMIVIAVATYLMPMTPFKAAALSTGMVVGEAVGLGMIALELGPVAITRELDWDGVKPALTFGTGAIEEGRAAGMFVSDQSVHY